jgi:hypothetical protein
MPRGIGRSAYVQLSRRFGASLRRKPGVSQMAALGAGWIGSSEI